MAYNYIRVEDVKFHAPPIEWKQRDGSSVIAGVLPQEPYTPERLKALDEEYSRRMDEHRRMRQQMTTKTFDIPSKSDPNKTYQVTQHIDGTWECECKGYEFRRNCSHIEKAKGML